MSSERPTSRTTVPAPSRRDVSRVDNQSSRPRTKNGSSYSIGAIVSVPRRKLARRHSAISLGISGTTAIYEVKLA